VRQSNRCSNYWEDGERDAGLREVHGVTKHLRILRSTSPPLPGGDAGSVDYSPLELQLASSFTLASLATITVDPAAARTGPDSARAT
jgi:hypothetical protein